VSVRILQIRFICRKCYAYKNNWTFTWYTL